MSRTHLLPHPWRVSLSLSRLVPAGVCILLILLGLLSSGALSSASVQAAGKPEGRSATRALFQRRCSSCHESNGTGSSLRGSMPALPDFTNQGWQRQHSDAQLAISILDGKGGRMPSFRGRVNEDAAQDLVSLIRTFDPTYDPARVRPIGSGEFEQRWRALEQEMDSLRREFYGLSGSARER